MSNNVEEKHDGVVHVDKSQNEGESNDTEEQRNAESAPMVSVY